MLLSMENSDKRAWRASLLSGRRALSPLERVDGDALRDAHLRGLTAGRRVAAYAAFGTEPVVAVQEDWLLPVLLPDSDLSWARAGVDLGVEAIASCDVVLVPALAVDRSGVRLGRGGGSYDRALARATGLVVAVLHEGELVERLPAEEHDQRVHAVALPSGVVTLTSH